MAASYFGYGKQTQPPGNAVTHDSLGDDSTSMYS